MAIDLSDEDYIDMEVSSISNSYHSSMNNSSPPHPREFEFQMFSSSSERETTTSPADELFYKGKLLPLHLPPRLQMVEKLLLVQNNNSSHDHKTDCFEEDFTTPLTTTTNYSTPTANTPFESCNISPTESCHTSGELNPNEDLLEYSTEATSFINENVKKSWTRKLKMIKKYALGSKLKASKAYFKSLFSKSGCSDEFCDAAPRIIDEGSISKSKENTNYKFAKANNNKIPFGQIQRVGHQMPAAVTRSFSKEKIGAGGGGAGHRRSFSGAFKRFSTTKSFSSSSSSSSSCNNSNGFLETKFLRRSSSVSSDIENSIQGAIAHCKRSQREFHSTTATEVGFYSSSASRIIYEDQQRPRLGRG
ncbi:hypothetical protein U1Q18_050721 [Sarracenia purpurea var. burkii]